MGHKSPQGNESEQRFRWKLALKCKDRNEQRFPKGGWKLALECKDRKELKYKAHLTKISLSDLKCLCEDHHSMDKGYFKDDGLIFPKCSHY